MKKLFLVVSVLSLTSSVFAQWNVVHQDSANYTSMCFLNDSTGYVSGTDETIAIILKTIDYGEHWDTVFYESQYLYDIYFPSDSIGYASSYGSVLKSTDYGETWFDPNTESDNQYFQSIYFLNDTLGYGLGVSGSGLGITEDGAITWTIIEDYGGDEILASDSCIIDFVAGDYYNHTDDCLQSWDHEEISPNDNRHLNGLKLTSSNVYVCGQGTTNALTSFSYVGKKVIEDDTWNVLDFPNVLYLAGIDFPNETFGVTVGRAKYGFINNLFATDDAGETWHNQEVEPLIGFNNQPYHTGLRDVTCLSESLCYACGGYTIYRTMNGGGPFTGPATIVSVLEESKEGFGIYPNPASNVLTISGILPKEKPTIKITDTTGRLVMTEYNQRQIDVSQLPSGIYFIEVSTELSRAMLRFIKE